jgi:hypothetical protein
VPFTRQEKSHLIQWRQEFLKLLWFFWNQGVLPPTVIVMGFSFVDLDGIPRFVGFDDWRKMDSCPKVCDIREYFSDLLK